MKAEHVFPPVTAATTLLPWLLATLADSSRSHVKELLRSGRVLVNGHSYTRHDHALHIGDCISVARVATLAQATLKIVHDDDAIIVIDKPSGLLTVATATEKLDTAFVRLSEQLQARPFVVHRIDRETSGLLLFARSRAIGEQLQASWDCVEKTYLAVVEGKPPQDSGRIENYLLEGRNLRVQVKTKAVPGAQRAVSHYRVVSQRGGFTLVEVRIETGRKHQIRVHLSGLGCPVLGDPDYGATANPARRLALHATRLVLPHPVTQSRLGLQSPLPVELEKLIS